MGDLMMDIFEIIDVLEKRTEEVSIEAAKLLRRQAEEIKHMTELFDKTLQNWAKDMEKFRK
jgi:flavoprotein